MQSLWISAALLGGVGSPPTMWWVLAPVMATAGDGLRGGLTWSALTVVGALLLHAAQVSGALPITYLYGGWENLGTFTSIGVLLLVGVFLYANDATYGHLLGQLQRAQQDAEAASRAKSVFLANMSHELRTPLNAVLGYTEIVAEDAEALGQPRMVDDLSRVRRSGQHLLRLLNDILDLSKIEAGRMEIVLEPVHVDALVAEVIAEVEPLLRRNRNQLHVEIAPKVVARADRVRLRQCLLNLLSNAAKFTRDGSVTIRARPGSLEVSDTGIGMDESQLAKLFEPFVQGSAAISQTFGGTGLGMAIVRKLVEQMDGSIDVHSVVGKGTRVTLRLPAG